MSNAELLDSALGAQSPDDYDGCFSPKGEYERDASRAELERRLRLISFLPPSIMVRDDGREFHLNADGCTYSMKDCVMYTPHKYPLSALDPRYFKVKA